MVPFAQRLLTQNWNRHLAWLAGIISAALRAARSSLGPRSASEEIEGARSAPRFSRGSKRDVPLDHNSHDDERKPAGVPWRVGMHPDASPCNGMQPRCISTPRK